jgi:hypothetical protein
MRKKITAALILLVVAVCFSSAQAETMWIPTDMDNDHFDRSFSTNAVEEVVMSPIKRIICGSAGKTVTQVFYWWEDVQYSGGVELTRFDPYSGEFKSWDDNWNDPYYFWGAYRLHFQESGCTSIEGKIQSNLGGSLFEEISLDALSPFLANSRDTKKLGRTLVKELKKKRLKREDVTVWLTYNTEGYVTSDFQFVNTFPDRDLVMVIPTNTAGDVDVSQLSDGTRGITLLGDLPYFVITTP